MPGKLRQGLLVLPLDLRPIAQRGDCREAFVKLLVVFAVEKGESRTEAQPDHLGRTSPTDSSFEDVAERSNAVVVQ